MGETASLKVPSLPSKPSSGFITLKWKGVHSSRSGGLFVAHHGGAPGVPDAPFWASEFPHSEENSEFSALQSSSLVELALHLSP